jgi:non-ribosomal peptide synthetase component F
VQAAVPSVLQLWLPALAAAKQQLSLLQLVSSGEMLPAALAEGLLGALPDGCLLLNLYGKWPLLQQQFLDCC